MASEADNNEAATQAGAEQLGDFELLEKLGGGGMGTVYRARQRSMDREVAVKILHEHLAADPNFVERFVREAQASGRLTHPNIIRGITAGKLGNRFYIAMEFVNGETASDLLRKRGRLAPREAVPIVADVARALQHAHARHIVHRDIKPSNIMIDHEQVVKLADLGLATAPSGDSGITQAGGVYGTPAYMAPEQALDAAHADQRSDIYALGVTLYHLLSGRKPFGGSSVVEILDAKGRGTYRPLHECVAGVPEALERIIDKMMRPEPRDRFQSAGEVVAALEATGLAGAPPARAPTAKARRPSRTALAASLAMLVLVTGVAAAWFAGLRPPWLRIGQPNAPTAEARRAVAEDAAPGKEPGAVPATDAKQVALGVMLFKMHGGEDKDEWEREALRDGLNAQLSGLSQVKVYSKEFIDFLITRKGLTEIEAASQLGIKKMLTGSVMVRGTTVQIETHVVDVSTGVLEASYTTVGSQDAFLDLPAKLAMETIARLDLPVTEKERQALFAKNETTSVEALKLLLDAERGGPAAAPGPRSDATLDPLSGLARLWLAVAHAEEAGSAQQQIEQVLSRYRQATEARQIKALAELYSDFPKEQEEAQQRYFENVRDLRVAIADVDVAVVGDEAVVSYTRTDDFVDTRTGRPMHVAVRLTKTLRNEDGAWKLVAGK